MKYEKTKNNFSLQPSALSVQKGFTQHHSYGAGFTLMEAIVAIFLITTGIVGVLALVTQTISSATLSTQRLTAAYLAQEGIEIVRNIRDTNWLEQYTNPANSWDEGLTINCPGACNCPTGCIADYTYSVQSDPDLPAYADQYLNIDGGFYSYSAGTQTKFKRKITISPSGGDILQVSVLVEWSEKGTTYQVEVQENLYNWK